MHKLYRKSLGGDLAPNPSICVRHRWEHANCAIKCCVIRVDLQNIGGLDVFRLFGSTNHGYIQRFFRKAELIRSSLENPTPIHTRLSYQNTFLVLPILVPINVSALKIYFTPWFFIPVRVWLYRFIVTTTNS